MTIQEYWDALKAHDWYYEYSDDGSVWRKGKDRERTLCALSHNKEDPRFRELWDGFRACYSVSDERTELPARPE